MSFRVGNQGPKMWPYCIDLGVAAITYYPIYDIDLSRHNKLEPKEKWSKLSPSQKYSLACVAYEMKQNDIIYVKEGPKIVGKGTIVGTYQFDGSYRIKDTNNVPWAHQIPVEWESHFPEVDILLGAEQFTVRKLEKDQIFKLEDKIKHALSECEQMEALEGEIFQGEAKFRSRNRLLIHAKKKSSDYRCEVCRFKFMDKYGLIGKEHIIAHHINPIAKRSGPSITTLNDISLVCANCHAMLHTKNPPIHPKELKKILKN